MQEKSEKSTAGNVILEVALIGAGPAGLIATKQLIDICGFTVMKPQMSSGNRPCVSFVEGTGGSKGSIAIFEETGSVGGVWTRDPERQRETIPCTCRDSEETSKVISVPASSQPMYEDLIANLPKDMSSFTDRPFPSELRFFPTPEEVATYYEGYSNWYGFDKTIHFNSRVQKCWKVFDEEHGGDLWHIQVQRSTKESSSSSSSSDTNEGMVVFRSKRIVVCSGHHRKAFAPDIQGLRHFTGDIRHSSSFQTPKEDYHGKSVLVVGGGISGNDIAGILSKCGCKVYVSVRKWATLHKTLFKRKRKEQGVIIRPGIDRITEDGSVLFKKRSAEDGHENGGCCDTFRTSEKFDAIILATGYRYWYPYLPNGDYMSNDGYKMNRLYMRVLHIDDPSLAFIGVTNFNFSPAIMMEYQSKWYATVVVKEKREFDRLEMEREAETHDSDGTQDKLLFQFPSYCNSLARMMSGEPGYWTQLLFLRLPWHIKSLRTRGHPSIYWALGVLVPATLLTIGLLAALVGQQQ
jgi:cation diffusion facilitator CzcD-associated flavoprotein CzcO